VVSPVIQPIDLRPYPLGFLVGSLTAPSHFEHIADDLYVHPETPVQVARAPGLQIFLIGRCVSVISGTSEGVILSLINALRTSEAEFHRFGDGLCGRYAIIYSRGPVRKIVTDATAMRSVFFTCDGSIAGSHAKLVSDSISAPLLMRTPFKGGHPGRFTPYPNILMLTPNTSLELGTGRVSRFFPRKPITPTSPIEAADRVAPLVLNALNGLNAKFAFSLTAGLDSRATLAIAGRASTAWSWFTLEAGQTIGSGRKYIVDTDVKIAREIANFFTATHSRITASIPSDELLTALKINSYKSNLSSYIFSLIVAFGQRQHIHIRSNLLEIGRAYYIDFDSLDTFYDATRLFLEKHPHLFSRENLINRAFKDFYVATEFNRERMLNYDMRDMFYWEHRMSAWHGQILLSSDLAFDTFIPWNSRTILNELLRVPSSMRENGDVSRLLVERAGLNKWPINPPRR
jgi:hypothetical protein